MGCCDELEGSCDGPGASSSYQHAHGKLKASADDASPQYSRRTLPPYSVWRARQLSSRDLLFGTFLMLITLIYLYRTAPKLCDEAVYARLLGVRCTHIQREHECLEVCQKLEQPPGLVWKLVCQYLGDPTAAKAVHADSLMHNGSCSAAGVCPAPSAFTAVTTASSLRLALSEIIKCSRSAVRKVFRAVVMFFIAGALSGDPFHITMPLLRLSLLLLILVPMPYPNLVALWHAATAAVGRNHPRHRNSNSRSNWVMWYHPRQYWQYPDFRLWVVILQRVLTGIAAFACVGFRHSAYFESTLRIAYWQGLGKYAVEGWIGWMLVLPMRLHLVVSMVEWLFFYALGVQIERLYHGLEGFFSLYHFTTSLGLIVVLPTVGVWWLERCQLARYRELERLTGSNAGSVDPAAQNGDVGAAEESKKPYTGIRIAGSRSKLQSASSSSSSIASSSMHAEPENGSSSRRSSNSSEATAFTSQSSPARQQLYDNVVGSLQLLKAQNKKKQQVAAGDMGDAAAAMAAAASLTRTETTDSRAWPAVPSVLAGVGPALRSVLADEAAEVFAAAAACAAAAGGAGVAGGISSSYTSMAKCLPASIKVHTAHSNVSLLEPLLTSCLASQVSQYSSTPGYMQAACFAGCVQLLANIFTLGNANSNATSSKNSSGIGGAGCGAFAAAAREEVIGGGNAATTLLSAVREAMKAQGGALSFSKREDKGNRTAAAELQMPCRTDSANAEVDVVFANTMASTTGPAAGSNSDVALVAAAVVQLLYCEPACLVSGREQQLVLHVQLDGAAIGVARLVVFKDGVMLIDEEVALKETISVSLVVPESPGVVNIALLPPRTTTATGAAEQEGRAAAVASPAVPLLLAPLLVLPEAAAQEVQRYWQQIAAADDSSRRNAADWESSILPVTVDIAYVLAASSAAAASKDSAAEGELRTVLKHLLMHLARCGMFFTMQLLVTAAAAAQQGLAAADSAEGSSDDNAVSCCPSTTPAASGSSSCSKANCSDDAAASAAEIQPAVDGDSCKPSTSSTIQSTRASAAGVDTSVAASELLWGFKNPAIESSYQAATFNETSMLDCACAVYNLLLSLSCYPGWGKDRYKGDMDTLGMPGKPSSAVLMFSRLLVLAMVAAGPVGVILVRLRASRQLQALAQRQQQQQLVHREDTSKGGSSSSTSSPQQQQQPHAEQVFKVLAHAASMKQWLQLYWMVGIIVWGIFLLAGAPFIAPPMSLLRVWASSCWAADMGITVSVALRGWVSQVPLAWHLPLIVTELAFNAIGSLRMGVHPPYWPFVRFMMGVILPVGVATWQHRQGRRRFCATRGLQVV